MGRLGRVLSGAMVLVLASNSGPAAWAAAPDCPRAEFVEVRPKVSPQTRPVRLNDRTIHVLRSPITALADIAELRLGSAQDDAALYLKFKPEATQRLTQATTGHSGVRLAFVVGNEALLSITWEGDYGLDASGSMLSLSNRATARRVFERLKPCLTP